jgi:tight adherence protein B
VSVAGQPGTALGSYSTPSVPAPVGAANARSRHSSFWQTTTAAVLACIVCAALIGLAVLLLVTPRRSVRTRLASFISSTPVDRKQSWATVLLERAFAQERERVRRSRRWARFVEDVELARIGLSVPQIVGTTLVATVIVGWVLLIATGSVIGALLGLLVPVGVRIALGVQVSRQRRAFDEQLPDNLQVVASAMRAGHTFVGALAVMAEDAPEPSRRELRRVLADEQLGVPLIDALNNVTARMDSKDFEHVALVASLQRETGGNTAEVIDTVTETIRERLELRRLVSTLTAQGRLSGWIVSLLPVILLIVITLLSPHYVHPLFHRTLGIVALAFGAALIGLGFWFVRRIVDIEI